MERRNPPHSQVHNERTVPIIIAGCITHARNGHISTSALKYDVTIVFPDPDSVYTELRTRLMAVIVVHHDEEANSVPQVHSWLVLLRGHFATGRKRGEEGRKGGKMEGRKGAEGMGEKHPQ